ncbi:aldehyde dehydrogenase family protein [Candidatus Thioglobus sp. NP1]|uniref:aldehyde dehydrogenase family protein n=1 Tax=Candidatus Thioglobus sp. NP1 TaxID=2508687 RepID=UPI000DED9617|nr:aldehyde dehydrogenase family protein [Candidatus Thioglobus sp. NP1]AXE62042.1 aldehyde dehydrogenase [Candidatus Thioglobus sp. NP1]
MTILESFDKLDYSEALESSSEAQKWLEDNGRRFGQFINGKFISQKDAEIIASLDPSNGDLLANIEIASDSQLNTAVKAARQAQPNWQALGGHGRAKVLYALARLIQKNARLIAVLETLDNGKPIRESRDIDIPLAIRHFYHHAGWAQLQEKEFKSYESIGVVAQIVPWNFPLLMLSWKIAPALAMGNTIVFKAAEQTPITAMYFAHLCQQAGIPSGVINMVNGDGVVGASLAAHKGIDKVAFTGSTAVGQSIRKSTAGQGKKLTLELGGKSAFVVFEDADLDAAVEGLVDSIWFNQGEVCCAGSRLLVQAEVAEKLHLKIKARIKQLRLGLPLDKSIDLGSLVSKTQFERVSQMVNDGLKHGGESFQACDIDAEKNLYPPTLITDIDSSHPLAQEEIFGPVLVSMTFRTQSEAVALANNSRYGLAASVWSENINRAMDVAPKIKAGVLWINCHNQFDASCGFGGVKESGFGREGGKEGLYEYLKPKYLSPVKNLRSKKTNSNKNQSIDRTLKFYIGGKQVRPDGGHSIETFNANGTLAAVVGSGNRKDIRNAVNAAVKATSWSSQSGHGRAQILYFLAENLAVRESEWIERLETLCGISNENAKAEFDESISRIFSYAAWADKYDGAVHSAPYRGVTMALPEPIGVLAQVAPENQPLLTTISLIAPAIAMGNRVILIPSDSFPSVALELVQTFETSDIPPGVINIVTGNKSELSHQLVGHVEVDGVWCWSDSNNIAKVETISAMDLKRLWVHIDGDRDWLDSNQGEGLEFLRNATEVKNIWTPYGD